MSLIAYGKLSRNDGATTKGSTDETVDGMSLTTIDAIIAALRTERYRWTPVRRVSIEKKHSTKKRPLGLPTWSDKLLQEVIRLILDSSVDIQCSEHSHGFRPGRGCQTAFQEISETWAGTTWLLEGDLSACFDSLSHDSVLETLAERIHDGRFLQRIRNLLKAGYVEDGKWNRTLSGAPHGSIIGPILSNIYLSRLDTSVETTLIPAYTKGGRRKPNAASSHLNNHIQRKRKQGKTEEVKALEKQRRELPSGDPYDPEYRRLRYLRYADDFLLSFLGPKEEIEEITRPRGAFLQTRLTLELSQTKTLMTHARTEAATFLGSHISTFQRDDAHERSYDKRRVRNGKSERSLPKAVIQEHCRRSMRGNKAIHRPDMENDSVCTIISFSQSVYRGIAEYDRMAHNVSLLNTLTWIMDTSLTKTLAAKRTLSVRQVYETYHTTLLVNDKPDKGLQTMVQREGKKPLIAQWGGIPLQRRMGLPLNDAPAPDWDARVELVQRLLAETCERCGSHRDSEVHHIRALKDLKQYGRPEKPAWVKTMAARRRKTLVVCRSCHRNIHQGQSPSNHTHPNNA